MRSQGLNQCCLHETKEIIYLPIYNIVEDSDFEVFSKIFYAFQNTLKFSDTEDKFGEGSGLELVVLKSNY